MDTLNQFKLSLTIFSHSNPILKSPFFMVLVSFPQICENLKTFVFTERYQVKTSVSDSFLSIRLHDGKTLTFMNHWLPETDLGMTIYDYSLLFSLFHISSDSRLIIFWDSCETSQDFWLCNHLLTCEVTRYHNCRNNDVQSIIRETAAK